MFINFFLELKQARVPVSLREYLTLMEAMESGLAEYSVDDFYYLSRSCLVKDETNPDKFDRGFGLVFKGLLSSGDKIRFSLAPGNTPVSSGDNSSPQSFTRRRIN